MDIRLLAVFLPIGLIAFMSFMLYVMAGTQLVRFLGNSPYISKIFGTCIIVSGFLILLT